MQLKPGSNLQSGKYEILRVLGQGGFGITYLAEQVALHRKVAVKEFFMKEYCERDESTSYVTLGATAGSKELVARFRTKFIREAQMIAALEHPHIVKIHDVFEENGTAYYVMEFLEGDALSDKVKKSGPLPEEEALKYIRQVGDALSYLHQQNCLHFDVKPSNILVNKLGNAVLIDFGVSKHYDQGGSQTSSTPVGISKGYAPMEQYQQAEISTFTPATDIYALGATLYTLVTGQVPPSASEIYEDGVPEMPERISATTRAAIEKAMQPRRKDRPQSIEAFFAFFDSKPEPAQESDDEETTVVVKPSKQEPKPEPKPVQKPKPAPKPVTKKPEPSVGIEKKSKVWLWAAIGGLAAALVVLFAVVVPKKNAVKADNRAYATCITANDFRDYIANFGQDALHYAEAQQFIETFVADSTQEALAQLEEQKRLEAEARKKKIGDLIVFETGEKGIVFWVDKTEEHGLVVALDEGHGAFWNVDDYSRIPSDYYDEYEGYKSVNPGKGARLTSNLIKALGSDAVAATWARKHGKDWYLPSNGEMFYMLRKANKWQDTKGPVSQALVENGGVSLSSKRYGGDFTSSLPHTDLKGGWIYMLDEDSMYCSGGDGHRIGYRAVRRF